MFNLDIVRVALKWGIIFGIVNIILNSGFYLMGNYNYPIASFLFLVVLFCVFLYISLSEYKELKNHLLTLSEGVLLGLILFLTAGLIVGSFDLVYKQSIDPTIVDRQLKIFEERYETMGLPEEALKQTISSSRMWMTGNLALVSVVINYLILGGVTSFFMTLFLKNKSNQ